MSGSSLFDFPEKQALMKQIGKHKITQKQTRPDDKNKHSSNVLRLGMLKKLLDRLPSPLKKKNTPRHDADDELRNKIITQLKSLDFQELLTRIPSGTDPHKNLEKIRQSLVLMKQVEENIVALLVSGIQIEDLKKLYE